MEAVRRHAPPAHSGRRWEGMPGTFSRRKESQAPGPRSLERPRKPRLHRAVPGTPLCRNDLPAPRHDPHNGAAGQPSRQSFPVRLSRLRSRPPLARSAWSQSFLKPPRDHDDPRRWAAAGGPEGRCSGTRSQRTRASDPAEIAPAHIVPQRVGRIHSPSGDAAYVALRASRNSSTLSRTRSLPKTNHLVILRERTK